jgi:hypothetical protein
MITSLNKLDNIFASTICKITDTVPCPDTRRLRIAANKCLVAGGAAGATAKRLSLLTPMKVFTP